MKIGRRQALVGGALIAGGCGKMDRVPWRDVDAGSDASAEAGVTSSSRVGVSTVDVPPCDVDVDPFFAADRRLHAEPSAPVLYSWTTPEQVTELRQGKVLFTRTERPGLGPGYAMDLFAEIAKGTDERAQVAAVLAGPNFAKARYAWTSAWATRMGWPGESYGNQLLRIVLRPEAYTLAFVGHDFFAFEMTNRPIPLRVVLASPDRIGAVYFVKDDVVGSCATPDAGHPFDPYGSFSSTCVTGVGYREYILGNEAMVAEWSLATDAIRAEIERARSFVNALRQRLSLAVQPDPVWNARVVDAWGRRYAGSCSANRDYMDSLAIPSPYYEPIDSVLSAIVDTLAGDLFTPDPFVVQPG